MKEIQVIKFQITSDKALYFREPKIEDTELSAQIAGKKAGSDNQAHLAILLQKEMVKRLLVKVDDHVLTSNDKETLDKFLTYKEYQLATKCLKIVLGDEEGNSLMPEMTTSGVL